MVILLMGVSGCGKTTVGRELSARMNIPFYDGDDYHPPENVAKMSRGQPLTEADRAPWLEKLGAMVRGWARGGRDAILACSALTRGARSTLGVQTPGVHLVYLRGPRELIARRLRERRNHFMPPGLLDSQLATLEEPENALTVDIGAAPAALADEIARTLRERSPATPRD